MAIPANSTRTSIAHRRTDIVPHELPKQYAIQTDGLHQVPAFQGVARQVFSTVIPPRKRDAVALWRRPETLGPNEYQIAVYILSQDIPAGVRLGDTTKARTPEDVLIYVETVDHRERLAFRASELEAIHTWVCPLPPGRETFHFQPQEREANRETVAVTSKVRTEQTELSLLAPTSDGPITMSSQEIADLLGNRHDKVKQSIERLANRGVISHPPMGDDLSIDAQGKERVTKVYRLDKRSSLIVVAQLSPEFTAKVVDRWQVLEEAIKQPQPAAPQFPIPQTFAEALMLAANQAAQIEHQKERIVEMAPKAEFHDDVASAVNAQDFMSVAKAFGTGRTRFTNWLKARKFIMENRHPYQQYADAGYFRVIEKKRKDRDTGEKFTYTQTLITGKGFTYLQRKWAEDHKGESA